MATQYSSNLDHPIASKSPTRILDPPLIMRKIAPPTPKYPVTYAIGPLGWIGMTAYFPLIDPLNGNLQPGQTVFVSAAAGAVGQIVCQIAKMIVGPEGKVVASAGSEEKCRWLKETIGVDGVFNYKERDVGEALKELCRNGIHVYYDNVGGQILDATIPHMVLNGRIIACGSVSKCGLSSSSPNLLLLFTM